MEFLVEFEVEVPAGTPDAEVEHHQRAESAAAAKLAEDGHLVRSGDGRSSATEQRLPLAGWLRVTVTPLEAHPNDPAAGSR